MATTAAAAGAAATSPGVDPAPAAPLPDVAVEDGPLLSVRGLRQLGV